jgi:hypothetical protein
MKIILGIIAFTLTFGLSSTLVGLLFGFPQPSPQTFTSNAKYSSAYKYKIKRLLKRDVRNGELRNRQVDKLYTNNGDFSSLYSNAEYRQSINDYYVKSSSMNDSNLPDDFKYAWREHMKAWKNQASYLNSLQDGSFSNGDESPVENYTDNTNEINRTWFQVLRIAERYGVEINRNYYR